MKSLNRWLLWVADGIWYALPLVAVTMLGCASRPVVKLPPIPTVWASIERATTASVASVEPVKLRGCAWDYYDGLAGITFEVWSSTNLVNWVLATNTVETVALFPVKPMEFYKVRARDYLGQVSDWATVAR